MGGACRLVYAWERLKMHIKFWSENLKGRINLEDLKVDRRIILRRILKKQAGME
jgi:hypothetical protein